MMSDFHSKVGVALNSPYFNDPPEELDGDELIQWYAARDKEKSALKAAAQRVESQDALPEGEAAIMKKAMKAIRNSLPSE